MRQFSESVAAQFQAMDAQKEFGIGQDMRNWRPGVWNVKITPERKQLIDRIQAEQDAGPGFSDRIRAILGDRGEMYIRLRMGGETLPLAVIKAMRWDQE